jgi:hypothetical protein
MRSVAHRFKVRRPLQRHHSAHGRCQRRQHDAGRLVCWLVRIPSRRIRNSEVCSLMSISCVFGGADGEEHEGARRAVRLLARRSLDACPGMFLCVLAGFECRVDTLLGVDDSCVCVFVCRAVRRRCSMTLARLRASSNHRLHSVSNGEKLTVGTYVPSVLHSIRSTITTTRRLVQGVIRGIIYGAAHRWKQVPTDRPSGIKQPETTHND